MREAIRLAEVIRGHNLSVEVDRYCLFACANYVIAASSQPVKLRQGAIVGFHTSIRKMNLTTKLVSPLDAARLYGPYVEMEELYLRSVGVDRSFFDLAVSKIQPVCVGLLSVDGQQPELTLLASRLDLYMPSIKILQAYGFRIVGDIPIDPALVSQQARSAIGTSRNNLRWADDSRVAPRLPASLPLCTRAQLSGGA